MDEVTVLDGGMGRELKRIGAPWAQPEWSALALIESPEHVRRAHAGFAEAGAELITTNTYAVVPFHIGEQRFATDGHRLAALAGSLARSVADEFGVRVAGSLPPVLGSYMPDRFVADLASPILRVLVEAQAPFVDVWLAETVSSIAEASLVGSVLEAVGGERPLWVSYTLEDETFHADRHDGRAGLALHSSEGVADGPRLRSGESVADALIAAIGIGAELVAFNCSQPEVMEAAVREAVSASDGIRIGVYANVFEVEEHETANVTVNELRADVTPDAYVEFAERWVEAGATMVGGCCGVGPAHVSALSARWPRS